MKTTQQPWWCARKTLWSMDSEYVCGELLPWQRKLRQI